MCGARLGPIPVYVMYIVVTDTRLYWYKSISYVLATVRSTVDKSIETRDKGESRVTDQVGRTYTT